MNPRKGACILFVSLALVGLFGGIAYASFTPGQTLDPGCSPTDGTCIVSPFATSSVAYYVSLFRNWAISNNALTPTTTIGFLVNASSTIGSGSAAGGLTVNGGATTTGSLVVQGTISDSSGNKYATSTLTSSNGGCVPTTYTVSYTDSAFQAASTTATKTLFSLSSSRQKLCGAVNDPQTAFAGTSMTAITCSLGSATNGNSNIYLPSLDMTQTSESASTGGLFSGRDLSTADASLAVVLTCTATGANFGSGSATSLTGGKTWVTVYTTTLPAGN